MCHDKPRKIRLSNQMLQAFPEKPKRELQNVCFKTPAAKTYQDNASRKTQHATAKNSYAAPRTRTRCNRRAEHAMFLQNIIQFATNTQTHVMFESQTSGTGLALAQPQQQIQLILMRKRIAALVVTKTA